jgi:hypothetical protein
MGTTQNIPARPVTTKTIVKEVQKQINNESIQLDGVVASGAVVSTDLVLTLNNGSTVTIDVTALTGSIDFSTPDTWTANSVNVTIGTQDYPGSTIVDQSINYEVPGGIADANYVEGNAPIGGIFRAEALFYDATETATITMFRGIAEEPVGGAPPGFILLEQMFADPNNGDHSWSLGDGFNYTVDTVADEKTTVMGTAIGAVKVFEDTATSQTNVELNPSVGTQGFIFTNNLVTALDDAAAGLANVPSNALYKTPTGEIRVKL